MNHDYFRYQIMLHCWSVNPNERPSFTELREKFEGFIGEKDGYIDFEGIDEDNIYYKVPSFNSQGDEKKGETEEEENEPDG